ncbi:MAG TPA: AsmA-like C-terminal region-containing protein, partial [Gammaproteobacteria bacterium]
QQVPPLDINIHMLDWKAMQFRDISLQSRRDKKGMIIDHLEAQGPSISLVGKGDWLTGWRNPHTTTFDFILRSSDFGTALKQLEITEGVRNTEGEIVFKWQWNAEPHKFSWDLVNGEALIKVEDGSLSDIEPGAGRLLGLLNFETLLSLDFGSQVSKGFAFDTMNGKFRFNAGNSFTDDFMIKGKVADVSMQGRIGLTNEDYDQVITVIPGVGSTLTVIGAVAGGPVTAAVVHFVQKVFGINRMAAYKYSVKGPWSNPEVKLLVKPKDDE